MFSFQATLLKFSDLFGGWKLAANKISAQYLQNYNGLTKKQGHWVRIPLYHYSIVI